MSDDLATLGIKVDSSETVSAAKNLDVLSLSGKGADATLGTLKVTASDFAAAMRAAGGDLSKIPAFLAGVDTAAKSASASLASVAATGTAAFTTLSQNIAASVGLTSTVLKSASASANVFSQSLQGLASIQASKSLNVLTGEMLALKAVQDGMNWTRDTNALLGLDVAFKSAKDSAAVFAAQLVEVEATGAAVFTTLSENINASLGLTDAAFKKASASASVFGESLMGVAALQASVGEAAAASADVQVTASEATAAAAVESAAVQEAAGGVVTRSNLKLRESISAIRFALEGNTTRAVGSLSVLAQAFGVLQAAIFPIIAVSVALGGALALVENQINSGVNNVGDLGRQLGLTADQLDKVKSDYVTFGDVFHGVMEEIGDEIAGSKVSGAWQSMWNGMASFAYASLIDVTGVVQGTVDVLANIFENGGKTAAQAYADGFKQNQKDIDDMFASIENNAVQHALDRIKKEAGRATATHDPLASTDQDIQKLKAETAEQQRLNDAFDRTSLTIGSMTQQEKFYQETAGRIAHVTELYDQHKIGIVAMMAAIQGIKKAQTDYNATLIERENIDETNKLGDQTTLLQKEASVIGETTLQRVVDIATLQAQQEAARRAYNPDQTDAYVASVLGVVTAQLDLTEKTKATNSELAYQSDLLKLLEKTAQDASSGLQDAFGAVGGAIGGMGEALAKYASQQADFAKQQAKLDQDGNTDKAAQLLLTQKQTASSQEFYGQELANVKNLFSTKSGAYKVLNDLEGAYNALMLANNLAQIAANIPLTISNMAAGASKMFATLGPFGFAAVAAMVAVIAGLGFSGGGSGSKAAPVDPTKAAQDAQGAGSVLGDATLKSASIANSITALEKDTNKNLDYSSQMVTSLKAIQNSIGSLTSLLSQQLQVGGLFDTAKLGLGTSGGGGGILSTLLGGIFGSSTTTTTLLDQGINIAAATIGQAIASGVSANSFQTVQSTKKSSALFGLLSSTKTSDNTLSSALGSDFTNQIQGIVTGLRSTVLSAATKLGVSGAQQVVDSLSLNIGQISLKGLTGTQIQDALNAVFSKLGDQIAQAALPTLTQFQQVGEGSLETLSRLVNEYRAVDDAAAAVGFQFHQTGVDSLAARDALVQASGGLDSFTSQVDEFTNDFLTTAQQIAPVQKAVNDELARLGFVGISTKAQFAAIVQSLDVTTASGAQLYAALMSVAPAFAKVTNATTALQGNQQDLEIKLLQAQGNALGATALQRKKDIAALDASLQPLQRVINATQDLSTAYGTQAGTLNSTITTYRNFATSLRQYGAGIGAGSSSNPLQQYALARQAFNQTAALALTGDQTALGNLQSVSATFLSASQASSATSHQYSIDVAAVKSAVAQTAAAAQNQADVAQQQLDALNDSVSGLLVLNQSVLSVKDAIDALHAAQATSSTSDAAQAAAVQAAQAQAVAVQAASGAASSQDTATATAANTNTLPSWVTPAVIAYAMQGGETTYGLRERLHSAGVPGFASGLNYVPYDEYLMRAHKGEAVLNATQADRWRKQQATDGNTDLLKEVKQLRMDQKKQHQDFTALVRRFTQDGSSILVKSA